MDIMSTLISALIGITVVFAVLILLMLIISIMSKMMKSGKKASEEAPAVTQTAAPAPKLARGSCGDVMLFDVPDKTAAQLMAITAEKLGKPLNTLRFVSIKEVK